MGKKGAKAKLQSAHWEVGEKGALGTGSGDEWGGAPLVARLKGPLAFKRFVPGGGGGKGAGMLGSGGWGKCHNSSILVIYLELGMYTEVCSLQYLWRPSFAYGRFAF